MGRVVLASCGEPGAFQCGREDARSLHESQLMRWAANAPHFLKWRRRSPPLRERSVATTGTGRIAHNAEHNISLSSFSAS